MTNKVRQGGIRVITKGGGGRDFMAFVSGLVSMVSVVTVVAVVFGTVILAMVFGVVIVALVVIVLVVAALVFGGIMYARYLNRSGAALELQRREHPGHPLPRRGVALEMERLRPGGRVPPPIAPAPRPEPPEWGRPWVPGEVVQPRRNAPTDQRW